MADRLTRPLTPRDHPPLVTVDDACRYMTALPEGVAHTNAWQRTAELAISARERAEPAIIAALTDQLDLALFITYRADLGAMKRPPAPSLTQPLTKNRPASIRVRIPRAITEQQHAWRC
jgi:hypothetical protein